MEFGEARPSGDNKKGHYYAKKSRKKSENEKARAIVQRYTGDVFYSFAG